MSLPFRRLDYQEPNFQHMKTFLYGPAMKWEHLPDLEASAAAKPTGWTCSSCGSQMVKFLLWCPIFGYSFRVRCQRKHEDGIDACSSPDLTEEGLPYPYEGGSLT